MDLKQKVQELRTELASASQRMDELLTLADSEKRDLSETETAEYDSLEKKFDATKGEIERMERQISRQDELRRTSKTVFPDGAVIKPDKPGEFKNIGELLYVVRFNPQDSRLTEYRADTMSMQDGEHGGFMVPNQFSPTLMAVTPQEAIIRPRATFIDAGNPPDSGISMPKLNQTAAKNVYGGVTFSWVKEGGTKTQTDIALQEFELTPHEIAGYITITDKLLRNWQGANTLIEKQFRLAKIGVEDDVFLTGSGVARPKGVLKSGACISIARGTANTIVYTDIKNMYARAKLGGSLIWVASQTVLPQLMSIVDPGSAGTLIWQPSAREGAPNMLMGMPLLFNERSPILGEYGDLALIDASYYVIKDGSGPFVDASPHVYFTSNKTVIKIFWNVDGDAWLDEPLPLEGNSTSTVSPFVVLDTP